MLSKNGLLGQDLPALAKQALDLAYVNTLYSGIRTQQPKASFALAKFHCLQAVTDKQNSQFHKDECLRLIEMTNVLAGEESVKAFIPARRTTYLKYSVIASLSIHHHRKIRPVSMVS